MDPPSVALLLSAVFDLLRISIIYPSPLCALLWHFDLRWSSPLISIYMVFETFPIGSLLTLIGACATELGGRLTMAFYRLIAAVSYLLMFICIMYWLVNPGITNGNYWLDSNDEWMESSDEWSSGEQLQLLAPSNIVHPFYPSLIY